MNERIKEFAKQTGYIWHASGDPKVYEFTPEKLEKFAELLIKECARVIDRGDGEMSSQAETIWCNVCRDDILKHFGVER